MRGWDLFVDRRVENPVGDMLAQVKSGELAAAVIWGPLAGPLVKADPDLQFTPLLKETTGPRMFFRITMGVRPGEQEWKRQLNSLIRRNQGEIDAILRDAGVPLLDDYGKAVKEAGDDAAAAGGAGSHAGGHAGRGRHRPAVPEPDGFRGEPYRAPVPAMLAGATVIDTPRAMALHDQGVPFLDTLPRRKSRRTCPPARSGIDEVHQTIIGATWLYDTGYQDLSDAERRDWPMGWRRPPMATRRRRW